MATRKENDGEPSIQSIPSALEIGNIEQEHSKPAFSNDLHSACRHGRLDVVRSLVTDYTIESRDANGCTPLHTAAKYGHFDIVKYLISRLPMSLISIKISTKLSLALMSFFQGKLRDKHTDLNCNTPLHASCMGGHLDVVQFLISTIGCDPMSGNNEHLSCLHLAAQHGHLNVVEYLLEEVGSDVNLVDVHGRSPAYLAAGGGHLQVLKYLIVIKGADPQFKTSAEWKNDNFLVMPSRSLVHTASHEGHLNVVKYLLGSHDCSPSCQDEKHVTPLHLASQQGHMDIVEYLVDKHNCDPLCQDKDRITPLHCASSTGHLDVVKYFTAIHHSHLLVKDTYGDTPLHYAASQGKLDVVKHFIEDIKCDPKTKGRWDRTTLHVASDRGHLDIVKYLVESCHCDPLCPNENKQTPLHQASYNGHLNVVQYLNAIHNSDPLVKDTYGNTPLHYAASQGKLDVVKHFIEDMKCDPNIKGQWDRTPLHYASERGHLDVVYYLLESHHCDPLCPDEKKETPLHKASSHGRLEVVQYFTVIHKSDPLVKNTYGDTPLHNAASQGKLDVVKHFIEDMKCDPKTKGQWDRTPLHYASEHGHLDVVYYLVESGHCDPLCPDENMQTPLHCASSNRHFASSNRHFDVVQYLTAIHSDPLKDTYGNTPLHYAAKIGDMQNILYYVEGKKWCPLMQDKYGNNLLHVAAIYGQLKVVKYLTGGNELKKTSQFLCDPAIKNKNGLTALELALENGQKHIESYLLRATTNQIVMNQYALSPSIRILVIGNSGSGKSTLIKALCQNKTLLGKVVKVKGVVPLTAGIIPTTLQSKVFGSVSIYDFAGHEEYYASHEIILQQATQPLVLIAIDISLPAADIEKQMLYWLSILSNAASIKKHKTVHLIVVGSHADQVISETKISVEQTLSSAIDSETGESIQFHGLISCDCRYSGSSHMENLRQMLNAVCMSVRRHIAHTESDYSNRLCASLMHYLQHNISHQAPTITISKLRELIEQLEGPDQTLYELIEQDLLLYTCEKLHLTGHLLFLPHDQSMSESIIVLNQNTVLSRIHSCLGIIQKSLRNDIGMLEESELEKVLHEHLKDVMSPDLATKYLVFTQFCTKVSADQLLSTPENLTSSIYYFFPNLVLSEKPSNLWSTEKEDYTPLYTWCLKCSNPHHFFTPRFLHTLFIQLVQCEEDSNDAGFTIWKNGILIVHCNTTRTIIEVTNQTTQLNLMMQCRKEYKSCLVKQRSKFISMIKSLRNKISSNLELDEFFLPCQRSYPPEAVTKIFLSKVAHSLIEGYPSVVVSEDDNKSKHKNILTGDLLLYDSFLLMNKTLTQEVVMNRHSDTCVPHVTLAKIRESLKPCKDLVAMMQNEAGSGVKEITYSQLFRELCKYSVFTDGNLYVRKIARSTLISFMMCFLL